MIELYKILDTKNFIYINENIFLKEIFTLIFPEFENLKRLERLTQICDNIQLNKDLLLSVLLIDEKNNHEYFSHKYNISNDLKETLNLCAKNYKLISEDKDFLNKDLEKNIYYNGKKHLINLNIVNFVINSKYKLKDFLQNLKKILKSKTHFFPFDGKYLIDKGMKEELQLEKF